MTAKHLKRVFGAQVTGSKKVYCPGCAEDRTDAEPPPGGWSSYSHLWQVGMPDRPGVHVQNSSFVEFDDFMVTFQPPAATHPAAAVVTQLSSAPESMFTALLS
jgi:hypothetical protein